MISSSAESKANMMLGTVGLIFVILTSLGFTFFIGIFKESILLLIPSVIGLVCLAMSFASSFAIIRPRIRLSLINPRRANNSFHDTAIEETKFQIKANLINNLEFIQRQGNHDYFLLTRSYGLFIAGIIIFAIPIFIKIVTDFNN